jgi:hypothetical protein
LNPKGTVLINREFVHTKLWPSPQVSLSGTVDLEKEYKEALAGRIAAVMDIAVDGSSYLVLGETKRGHFIWDIDKRDTQVFLPIIKKNGIVMPVGMSPVEEFEYMAKYMSSDYKHYQEENKEEKPPKENI